MRRLYAGADESFESMVFGAAMLTRVRPRADATQTPTQTPTQPAVRPDVDDPELPAEIPVGTPGTRRDTATRQRVLRPYKVILHNDEHNSMDHVVESLRKAVPGMTLGKAVEVMWAAHTAGKALVISCPLELAELYQQRLLSFGLTATIEND